MVWFPDQSKIAFIFTDRSANTEVWTICGTDSQKPLSRGRYFDLAVNPDGSKLAFTTDLDDVNNICMLDLGNEN